MLICQDLSPSFAALKERLIEHLAYRTLCDIGKMVYSDEVDQHLASYIDDTIHSAGGWSAVPAGYTFKIGDVVRVKRACVPSQAGISIQLKEGYHGYVNFLDEEGDAQAWFPELLFGGLRGKHVGHWILAGNFENIEVKDSSNNDEKG